jgi:hypothetical protein
MTKKKNIKEFARKKMKKNLKRIRKQTQGLKKYNKIVSILVKEAKKKKEEYDIKAIRERAKLAYQGVKELSFKQINLKQLKLKENQPKEAEVEITAVDVDPKWFNDQENFTYFWQVGDWANQFSNAYPNIPIMLITKATEKNPLVVQGATGNYDGSIFQRWVEEIRDSLPDPNDYQEIGKFVGTPAYQDDKGQIYAVWYETGVAIPKVPPRPKEIEPRKKKLVDEAEEAEKIRYLIEKPKKKRGRPKKEKTEPLPKIKKIKPPKPPKKEEKPKEEEKGKPTPLRDKNKAKELLIKQQELLLKQLELKLITKKVYLEKNQKLEDKIEGIENMYRKGGKV